MKILKATEQKPEELTTIYGTGTSPHMPAGEEYQIHPADAADLVKAGHASLTKVKEKADKTEKKEKNHTAGPNDKK